MSEVWFTGDTHFGHVGALRFRSYFLTLETMNQTIIDGWNAKIGKGDRVYHLGDFSLAKPEITAELASQLNGQIYLIRGNHDNTADHAKVKSRFVWIRDYEYLKVNEQYIALCHYPFITWRNSHHGSWHLHGHCHGSLWDGYKGKRLDVGVDCNNWSPYHFEDIRGAMEIREIDIADHHDTEAETI